MPMDSDIFPNSMRAVPVLADCEAHVAIIMRTKDRPVLLARALSSVLNQTHADWHLTLVNDGGDRACVDLLVENHRGAFGGRITVMHNPASLGMEAASNAALAGCAGAFVCVHDDDDSWHPDFLATMTSFLGAPEHARFAAVVGHCTIIYERIEEDSVVEEQRVTGFLSPSHVDWAAMLRENQFPPISLMMRKRVIDAIGGFNAAMPVLGDWDYNLRILRVGDIGVVPQRLSYYHHRRTGAADSYDNSVTGRAEAHQGTRALYGNAMLRRLGQDDPALLWPLHVLLREAGGNQEVLVGKIDGLRTGLLERSYDTDLWNGYRHTDLRDRLIRVESELAELRHSLGAIGETMALLAAGLRPLRAIWRRMLPLRRLAARLRGRR